jgi:hypothetical protein
VNLLECMQHEALFGRWFAGPSWDNWLTVLRAAMALPPLQTESEKAFFRTVAGDRNPPSRQVREAWFQIGRRGGKDSVASAICAHAAAMFDGHEKLRPGERPLVLCLAADRQQASIVFQYIKAFFDELPVLKSMVVRETAVGFELSNGVTIEIGTNSYRAVRGRPIWRVVLDEVAFYRDETSSTPDLELYRALVPGLATLPGSMLIGISSPYRKAGLLYQKYSDHHGRDDGNVLFVKAPSLVMNPTLDPQIVADALQNDPAAAKSEWLAEPRDDISNFVDIELVRAAVDRGVVVRPPQRQFQYKIGIDVGGGMRDSYTACVSHLEGKVAILDAVFERRAPYDPAAVTAEVCQLAKAYRCTRATGDRYSAQWAVSAFASNGVTYENSERNRSEIYLDFLPLLSSGRARLLDHDRLVNQLASLERRTSPIGKDVVNHGVGGADDVINSAALSMVLAVNVRKLITFGNDELAAIAAYGRRTAGGSPGRSGFRSFGAPQADDDARPPRDWNPIPVERFGQGYKREW